MTQIKSERAKEYVEQFWIEQPNPKVIQMAYVAGLTEAEERHASELQQLLTKIEEGREREKIANDLIVKNRKELEALKEKAEEVFGTIAGHQAARHEDRWRSVEEELPEMGVRALVKYGIESSSQDVAHLNLSKMWIMCAGVELPNVTHWKPITE